jgi:hypothetical protein
MRLMFSILLFVLIGTSVKSQNFIGIHRDEIAKQMKNYPNVEFKGDRTVNGEINVTYAQMSTNKQETIYWEFTLKNDVCIMSYCIMGSSFMSDMRKSLDEKNIHITGDVWITRDKRVKVELHPVSGKDAFAIVLSELK